MHLPYTDDYRAVSVVAAGCVATTLGGVLWARPLPRRSSNALFFAGVATTLLAACVPELAALVGPHDFLTAGVLLQLGATLTTVACFAGRLRGLGTLAAVGQLALFGLWSWVKQSNDEMLFAHFAWYGTLLGAHALTAMPVRSPVERPPRLSYPVQDAVIFLLTVALATFVTASVYEFAIYNGDEVANSFQANVYAHLRAYAPVPACPSMFENYWVFYYQGRAFSQYTPGWPLFMALFERMHVIWLAGPVMGGIVAVGIAHVARRLAWGLGATYEASERIVAFAGPLAAALSMLGPSLLLNAASRFSHTMVAACFAWAVDSAAEVATPRLPRGRALAFGLVLGSTTALALATRPADGGFLGIGVFLYFAQAIVRRRVSLPAFVGTCAGFAFFAGVTAVILRLQLGKWFATGYSVTTLFRGEARLVLTFPKGQELKYGIPLATGSYCWWPIAPALAAVGLVRALGGRARGVSFMLAVSALCLVGFYSFVEFGRYSDDGLGPRYVMPIVVGIGAGTGACVAPIAVRLVDAFKRAGLAGLRRLREWGPGVVVLASAVFGVIEIAPRTYPVAYAEYHQGTVPYRTARDKHLKNALVLIFPEDAVQGYWNLNQNAPLDTERDILFLARQRPSDEDCARRNYPGRTWYRVHANGTLQELSADRR
ncbi:MAG TPA: hypothetical protein VMI54_18950 [Polyangiaceae bacterium]|nr:hypothetical protein [Polyangiaceae bacterium]